MSGLVYPLFYIEAEHCAAESESHVHGYIVTGHNESKRNASVIARKSVLNAGKGALYITSFQLIGAAETPTLTHIGELA